MNIIYKSIRVGKNGKLFKLYKLRTMVEGADKMGGPSTPADDSRLTRIGKFLRKYTLDEIPQIWNILKGDMNIIGPRPEVPFYINKMTEEEKKTILSVKPGLSDLATIWDCDEAGRLAGKENPEKFYEEVIWPEKKRLQIEYIKNHSIWLDIKIIVLTIWKVLLGR